MEKIKKALKAFLTITLICPLSIITILINPNIAKALESDVSINEFLADPQGVDSGNEWIEIYNKGETTIDLTNWQIVRDSNPNYTFTFPSETLAPKSYRVISDQELNFSLPNSGTHTLQLKNASGVVINSASYTGTITGSSEARKPDGIGAFVKDSTPTPGGPNNTPPPSVTLDAPSDGYATNNQKPAFSWQAVTDPDGDDVSYEFVLGDSINFSSPIIDTIVPVTNYQPSVLLPEGRYYWKVASYDGYETGDFSSTASLIIDVTPPTSTITTSGTFGPNTWPGKIEGNASDNLSGVDTVTIQIKDPSGLYWDGTTWVTTKTELNADGTTDWSYALTAESLTSEGTYTLISISKDKANNDSTEASESFIWDITPPDSPSAFSGIVSDTGVTLSWSPVDDAQYYEIWRASSEFVLIAKLSASENSYTDTTIERGKNYQYKIFAVDTAGNKSMPTILSIWVPTLPPVAAPSPAPIFTATAEAKTAAPIVTAPQPAEEITPSPAIEEGKILGEEKEQKKEPINWTPIVIIGCLIILFGAGYYGYNWYQKRVPPEDRW